VNFFVHLVIFAKKSVATLTQTSWQVIQRCRDCW